jgi:hypothetical protein
MSEDGLVKRQRWDRRDEGDEEEHAEPARPLLISRHVGPLSPGDGDQADPTPPPRPGKREPTAKGPIVSTQIRGERRLEVSALTAPGASLPQRSRSRIAWPRLPSRPIAVVDETVRPLTPVPREPRQRPVRDERTPSRARVNRECDATARRRDVPVRGRTDRGAHGRARCWSVPVTACR